MPPWEVTGERLTPWRRFVWRERRQVYAQGMAERNKRQLQELESKGRRR